MSDQSQAKLIIVVGLPGSGKSTHIEKLCKQNPGYDIYDDYQAGAPNDSADPRNSKHFNALLHDLEQGKTVIASDIQWCITIHRNMFIAAVLSVHPDTNIEHVFFENNAEQCRKNVISRNREHRVEAELALIAHFSPKYTIPAHDIVPVHSSLKT